MQLCGARLSEGIFVGAFLSMSSTAVVSIFFSSIIQKLIFSYFISKLLFLRACQFDQVVKFLVERNSTSSLHGQVTIGILIFQVLTRGILYSQIRIVLFIIFLLSSAILFLISDFFFQDCVVGLLFALLPVLGGNSGLLQGIISMGKL